MKRVIFTGTALALALWARTAQAQTAASSVNIWLINPHGEVDGVMLNDGRSVFFTTDVGRMLVASVRIGDMARVEVRAGRRIFVDERDGSEYDLSPPARGGGPVGIPALQRFVARGRLVAFTRTSEGAIVGFLMDSGEQVRVPPSMGARLSVLRVGEFVVVEGLGNRGRWGLGLAATSVWDARGQLVLRR